MFTVQDSQTIRGGGATTVQLIESQTGTIISRRKIGTILRSIDNKDITKSHTAVHRYTRSRHRRAAMIVITDTHRACDQPDATKINGSLINQNKYKQKNTVRTFPIKV